MRVLVTGASGFSGAFVAAFLANRLRCCRATTPQPRFLDRASAAGVLLVYGNQAEGLAVQSPFGAVVHTAVTSPVLGITTAQMVHENVDATAALLI